MQVANVRKVLVAQEVAERVCECLHREATCILWVGVGVVVDLRVHRLCNEGTNSGNFSSKMHELPQHAEEAASAEMAKAYGRRNKLNKVNNETLRGR